MLVHRLRRLANITPKLAERLVFAAAWFEVLYSVGPATTSTTLAQH